MGVDLDEVFAYETVKVVRVKDRYLGLLKILLMLTILLYIVVYVLILQRQYIELEVPIGSLSFSFDGPKDFRPYCKPEGGSVNIASSYYQYCKDFSSNTSAADGYSSLWDSNYAASISQDNERCVLWDPREVLFPSDSDNSVVLTTRISVTNETRVCLNSFDDTNNTLVPDGTGVGSNITCGANNNSMWVSGQKDTYYIAGIEQYSVGLIHSMYSRRFYVEALTNRDIYRASSPDMSGRLIGQNGQNFVWVDLRSVQSDSNVSNPFPGFNATDAATCPNNLAVSNYDVIRVGDLLAAAGVNLSALANSSLAANRTKDPITGMDNRSFRYNGLTLMVYIEYDNRDALKSNPVYDLRADAIPSQPHASYELRYIDDNHRISIKRNAIKILFSQTGTIGRFNFQFLLIQIASSVGLLSVASLLVELIMLKLLPLRKYYAKAKFEETEDYSNVRQEFKRQATKAQLKINDNDGETGGHTALQVTHREEDILDPPPPPPPVELSTNPLLTEGDSSDHPHHRKPPPLPQH